MGAEIKAAGLSVNDEVNSSVDHAVRAAERCIARADVYKQNIDLLVNLGVYRDNNIAEPAMGSLIQKKLNMNLDPVKKPITTDDFSIDSMRTFSFDLMNGPCGFLYAAQVVGCLLDNGSIERALVVSGDVHPSQEKVEDFPFNDIGGAALMSKCGKDKRGFLDFSFSTSEDRENHGIVGYCDTQAYGSNARGKVTVEIQEDFIEGLEEFVGETAEEFLNETDTNASEIDHLITTQPSEDFAGEIAGMIDIGEEKVVDIYREYGDSYTSALTAGYHHAYEEGLLTENDKVLFLAGGSGPTAACGLYSV